MHAWQNHSTEFEQGPSLKFNLRTLAVVPLQTATDLLESACRYPFVSASLCTALAVSFKFVLGLAAVRVCSGTALAVIMLKLKLQRFPHAVSHTHKLTVLWCTFPLLGTTSTS